MIARLRVVVEVPFQFDQGEPDENGNHPNTPDGEAELSQVKAVVAAAGAVLDDLCFVEELRAE